MSNAHGAIRARRARTLLRGALALAVMNNVLGTNPVRDGQMIRSKRQPRGASALSADQLRKSVATLIDDEGLSARVGADHLGHAKVSMTQDRYMARRKVDTRVADLLDHAVGQP